MIVSGLTFRGRLPSSSAAASAASAASDMFATTEKKLKTLFTILFSITDILLVAISSTFYEEKEARGKLKKHYTKVGH